MESKHTPMSKEAASRIQSAAARHPDSATKDTDFDRRAQSAADTNEHDRSEDDES